MAVKLRLARGGSKKRPFYKLVATQNTSPRDGRFIEKLGTYNPLLANDHSERVTLNLDRIRYWLDQGAKPSDRVSKLLNTHANIPLPNELVKRIEAAKKRQSEEKARKAAEEEAAKKAAAEGESAA